MSMQRAYTKAKGHHLKLVTRPDFVRLLWNKIRLSRKEHTLKCGCLIGPGVHYHSVGALINGKFTVTKQHLGCQCNEKLH